MKKLVLISLCAMLCVVFCACKGEESSSTESTTAQVTTAAATQPTTKNQTETAAATTADSNSSYVSAKEAAVADAKKFLEKANYSYQGLYNDLVYMGYADEDAKYGADNCGADWSEQAVKRAKALAANGITNYDNLVEKLESEGFTGEQAAVGAQAAAQSQESGQNDDVIAAAKKYVETGNYTYTSLIDKLQQDGFSTGNAEYAANNCGADWNGMAANEAKNLIDGGVTTKEEIVDQLIFKGYTYQQAVHGAEANGL